MRQAWRWFGPNDPVSLDDIRQAGATDVVHALHHVPPGEAWTVADVKARKTLIDTPPPGRSTLTWSIVESIPVPDDVKRLGGGATKSIETWIASLEAVAAAGIKTICYNFMPIVDWTRTDLDWLLPNGATALRFEQSRFVAFDLYILKRPGAEQDYSETERRNARAVFESMSAADIEVLSTTIAAGLPGGTTDALDLDAFRERLADYKGVDAIKLRRHLIEFLKAVVPKADALNVKLTLHPDDPPRPLFGLPRIASTAADYQALFDAVPSPANGMCYCTGSLGVAAQNDLPAIAKKFAKRIYFTHLRATRREPDGSFYEADHLDGDFDMVLVLSALLAEDKTRAADAKIPFRPDHGHRMLDDLKKRTNPGYSAIGRLRGLAELRGAIKVLELSHSSADAS
jgi:mannonate dehydratase